MCICSRWGGRTLGPLGTVSWKRWSSPDREQVSHLLLKVEARNRCVMTGSCVMTGAQVCHLNVSHKLVSQNTLFPFTDGLNLFFFSKFYFPSSFFNFFPRRSKYKMLVFYLLFCYVIVLCNSAILLFCSSTDSCSNISALFYLTSPATLFSLVC